MLSPLLLIAFCSYLNSLGSPLESPLFVIENRFDRNQIEAVLLCPPLNNSRVDGFVADFGQRMRAGLLASVQGDRGISKVNTLLA